MCILKGFNYPVEQGKENIAFVWSEFKNVFDVDEKEKINALAKFRGYPADVPFRMYNDVKASRTFQDIHLSIHEEKNVSHVKC